MSAEEGQQGLEQLKQTVNQLTIWPQVAQQEHVRTHAALDQAKVQLVAFGNGELRLVDPRLASAPA